MTIALNDLVTQAGRRARLAAVLSSLLLEEPGPDLVPVVADVPALRGLLGRRDLDVDFERLLLRDVAPYESVFTSADGQRGGDAPVALARFYERHGVDEPVHALRVAGVDHLGVQLRAYAHLCAAESSAWGEDQPDEAARMVEAERTMLAAHFGTWTGVAMRALAAEAASSPYASVAAAVDEFVAGEAQRLRPAPDHDALAPVAVADPPVRVGPASLARWLCAPARCGAFLRAADFAAASAALGIPWRASDPRSRFRRSVEAATDSGDLAELLGHLREPLETWRDGHAERERDFDGERRTWRMWRLRAEATLRLLERLSDPSDGHPTRAGTDEMVEIARPGLDAETIVQRVAPLGLSITIAVAVTPEVAATLDTVMRSDADVRVLVAGGLAADVIDPPVSRHRCDITMHVASDGTVTGLTVSPGWAGPVRAALSSGDAAPQS